MATLYDAPTDELIDALAEELDDVVEAPEWALFAKTGHDREMPPQQDDFWARRAASLLRKVAISGPVGVERLSTEYGSLANGSTRYRVAPAKKTDGSKNIIRTILQQLEDDDLVQQQGSEGRIVTGEGRSLLDETAGDVLEELDRPELERYA
ncbi:SSU ribosomal protein S19e [Halarchaeum acidiphilum MH1-52-1]|uniref:Small ribosomal subunit protein eS19 n=1 Tax=Halarchaeum acidiphilum MH1-52-1 TaxID=1261545 RepID=U2YGF2_9EURY|nr:30S ribosomal protein S19e [Halarchaeum acidiphilum]GAD53326.1 SSU ribosomal protein S19e [Halarchaeum acidiphilum MH1-52-1]